MLVFCFGFFVIVSGLVEQLIAKRWRARADGRSFLNRALLCFLYPRGLKTPAPRTSRAHIRAESRSTLDAEAAGSSRDIGDCGERMCARARLPV